MAKREWRVEAPVLFGDDGPLVDQAGKVVRGELDPQKVAELAVDVATVVRMVGGVAKFGAHREEVAPEVFETIVFMARWESYAPAARVPDPGEGEGEDEAVPEPIAVGLSD